MPNCKPPSIGVVYSISAKVPMVLRLLISTGSAITADLLFFYMA